MPSGKSLTGEQRANKQLMLASYWDRAAQTKHGITIQSENPWKLMMLLYAVRRELKKEAWTNLRIVRLEGEVRICKNESSPYDEL